MCVCVYICMYIFPSREGRMRTLSIKCNFDQADFTDDLSTI